ncbi:unnamed protein product [Gongylonema pulchrum]|uniref:TLC domain-containing protein n=1 Tax=Gongylonema pulchrum TaxID=637853 RepID=A0A183EEM7_9BILA|nr:unnamed protein product [Gongylonema pulchrum]
MDKYEGAEYRLPPLDAIWDPAFKKPFVCYFLLLQIVGYFIRKYAWKSYVGFKSAFLRDLWMERIMTRSCLRYRLCNLTVCVIHSSISGVGSFVFFVTHQRVMFEETIHWYSPLAAQLPIFSMAYFVCDAVDMLRHEISKWTVELLIHHAATMFAFGSAVLPHKFIPYAYWALLMEMNR